MKLVQQTIPSVAQSANGRRPPEVSALSKLNSSNS